MERERIESVLWQERPGADVIDVSQNPGKRARTIKRGEDTFMTVIAGGGYLVRGRYAYRRGRFRSGKGQRTAGKFRYPSQRRGGGSNSGSTMD